MEIKDAIEMFNVETDAFASNRGLYYQYLILLKKWLLNYISDNDTILYSEVDDDIKEVGNKLIFTQVKCYSTNLGFNSNEVKKSIFNYFILYLKYNSSTKLEFCFCTNTNIKPNEKLLNAWHKDPELKDENLKRLCSNKIKEIIQNEIKIRKRKKLEKTGNNPIKKDEIKTATTNILKQVNDSFINDFTKLVKWNFSFINPSSAIDELFIDIRKIFTDLKFKNKPVSIIESVLLSEIYRRSQLSNANDRVLSNKIIETILNKTEAELKSYINNELINLMGVKLQEIDQKFSSLEKVQKIHKNNLRNLQKRVLKIELNTKPLYGSKELTSIPITFNENIFGWTLFIDEIQKTLEQSRILSLTGSGGSGKTACVQKFILQYYRNYDHIIWIDASDSLMKAFIYNPVLISNLDLDFPSYNSEEANFKIICNSIQNIEGNNILVIDNYNDDLTNLKTVISITNFKILITTREKIALFQSKPLPKLDLLDALNIFRKNITKPIDDKKETVEEFLNFVDFHPLIIELCAKTISNSIDLNLSSLLQDFKNQNLNNENLHIDVTISNENNPVRLLNYLQKLFELNNLTENEKNLVVFLSLLPSEEILIDELAQIGGKDFYSKNKISFINYSNSLHAKGWIERYENTIKMQPLIQQIIIYNEREKNNPFVSNIFMFIWLFRRIDEVSQTNPSQSFKFLKYAESILNSIKEPFRTNIYQPLLLLENALLNSYNWFKNSDSLHYRWINLIDRAKIHLPNDDTNLGIMYNNLGLSYMTQNDFENGEINFINSIKSLEIKESETINQLLLVLNNLSFLYKEQGEITKARLIINRISKLTKKYSLNNSQNNAYHHFLNGLIYHDEGKLIEASNSFEKAIQIHLSADIESRSDLYLAVYYANLIYNLHKLHNYDKVKVNLLLVNNILTNLNKFENFILTKVNSFISSMNELYN